jgi:hypothetical protein
LALVDRHLAGSVADGCSAGEAGYEALVFGKNGGGG